MADLNKPNSSEQPPQSPYASSGSSYNPPPPPPAPPQSPYSGQQSPYSGQQPPYGGQQQPNPYGGPPPMGGQFSGAEKKLPAGLCGILLGGLGVHKFILGYNTEGVILLVASIFTCGLAGIVGFIEGIIYLTKSDQQFVQEYIVNKKPWF